jgi:hypothetical protein
MTAPELLLASLGSCADFYAVQYLKTRNLAEIGVEASVTANKLKQPARIGNFIPRGRVGKKQGLGVKFQEVVHSI